MTAWMHRTRRFANSFLPLALIASNLFATGCSAHAPAQAPAQTAAKAPTAPLEDIVIGHSFVMESAVLREKRRITLYLPSDYEKTTRRYPVLYLLDGGAQEDFHHITGIVQVSVANGLMEPIVVIGIENTERKRDMTGPTENAEDQKIAPRVGGSAAFRQFLKEELIPRIEKDIRGNGERTLLGESLAGLFVVETFFEQPGLFHRYIAVSPSLWWNNGFLLRSAAERLKTLPAQGKELYLTVGGQNDNTKETNALADTLRALAPSGLTWYYEPLADEVHATMLHAGALKSLRKFFAAKN